MHISLDTSKYITVSDNKKVPWRKNCPVVQQFLAVLYSVAFDI
jgi:hypothetical protein